MPGLRRGRRVTTGPPISARGWPLTFDRVIQYTLVYLTNQGNVLLIKKAPGRSHAGQWIGLGGKLEHGEDPVASAVRELREESGLTVADPKLRGTFIWIDDVQCGIVYIVTGTRWAGTLAESDEGALQWHRIADLPSLEGLARHQRLFLDRILIDSPNFYSGVAVYHENEMVEYLDGDRTLGQQST